MHVFARRSILGGALGAACGACTPAARADLAVTGARLYSAPGTAPIDEATILIGGGRILAAGPGREVRAPSSAQIIDARDCAVVAGFWNSHVHLISHELLHPDQIGDADLSAQMEQLFTRWGFTSVFDIASVLASTNAIRQRVRSGAVRGPNILTVGDPFYPLNGTPIYVRDFLEREGVPPAEVASVEEGVTRARAQLRDGADALKLFTGAIVGGDIGVLPMQPDLARALVEVAHAAGKPAFAHPSNEQGLNVALDAGVDILAHPAFMAGPWDDALVARLVGRRTALTPTLTLVEVEAQRSGDAEAAAAAVMQGAQQQVRAFALAGGDILFGTDIGYTQAYDTAREFRRMAGAGLGFPEILASLTTAPARRFGFSRRKGRIAPGMDADLVILAADPAQDIESLARVRHTIRGGEVIFSI
jgi:imidazolonepropionase-like amidohydrolase